MPPMPFADTLGPSKPRRRSKSCCLDTFGGFDFDNSLSMDKLEGILSIPDATGLLYGEMLDSNVSPGAFGQILPGGALDIGPAFAGAVFLKIPGS